MKKVLIASTNSGKVEIYRPIFNKLNIEVVTLNDFDMAEAPEENGQTTVENALIKARYYHNLTNLPTLANDSGLFIDKLSKEEQAGLFVRRDGIKELTDQEMIARYIEKLNKVGGKSTGHWDVGLAIINEEGKEFTKQIKVKFLLTNTPSPIVKRGIPLDSITYDKKLKKYKSELMFEERKQTERKADRITERFILRAFR